ncbi:Nif11-like leader peptide family natural product precursor [Lichenibacterium ramalinae]|uniref:Uncharacterized protein n=1 Tax=Lichenibacterium ramalinae TaxID=2316527 RepID=A0A4Q2REB2_9HYPH|nr:Nif11-like leader peptide family natural product precursor [Lichenibacterium ramalinae]RYB05338.1 hypothetical protein D3272_10370 [Lichenibacterium ramalinae]
MTPKTILLLFHILGVVFGVGGVLMLDIDLVRLLRGSKVTPQNVDLTKFVSIFVKAGLIVVWTSGLLIIAIAPDGPASVLANPKLQAKLVVVVVLTINALFVETLALPLLVRNVGKPLFHGVDQVRRSVVLGCGAISTLSWVFPVALGLARELNGIVPAQLILLNYTMLLAGLAITMQLAGRLVYRPKLQGSVEGSEASSKVADAGPGPSASAPDGIRMGDGARAQGQTARAGDPASDRSNQRARQAGRDASLASTSPERVIGDFASLGSEMEREQYRIGLFDALRTRGGSGSDADRLLELVAADEVLRRKIAAVAPDEAARGAFSFTVEKVRRRAEDRMWAKVMDWHASMVTLNAAEAYDGADRAAPQTAVAG